MDEQVGVCEKNGMARWRQQRFLILIKRGRKQPSNHWVGHGQGQRVRIHFVFLGNFEDGPGCVADN